MPRRLSVVAGTGALAPAVVDAALRAGDAVQVLALTDLPALPGAEQIKADLSNPQALMLALRAFGTTHIVLAGAVSLSDRRREELAQFITRGESLPPAGDAALSSLADALRSITGAELIGPHEVALDLVAGPGHLAGPRPTEALLDAGRLAFAAARHIGRLDLGQAAVVAGERVVAVEDVGGTDELLARVRRYREQGLVGDGSAGLVLAKASKPQQPLFVDLPAVGRQTVANASAAGVRLIVVEAGRTLLLEREALFAAVEAEGIGIYGLAPHE
jgi:DUF1009 family protein